MTRFLPLLFLPGLSAAGYAQPPSDPPVDLPSGIAVAESEPRSSSPPGVITCAAGRFVPVVVSGGKPTLLLGNEAGLLEVYPLAKGEAINGVRYDEPAGAKTKRYTFPKGATHYVVAGDVGGTVTLTSVVNGVKSTDAPTVAGKLVLTLTAPMPPPVPPSPVPPTPVPPAPVPPTPVPVTSFRVIYVTESATALTKTQNAVINAQANVAYLNSKVTKTNSWPDWRSYDPQTPAEKDYPGLAAMWAAAKPAVTTVPCVIIQVNDKVTIEPFPATAADALTLLKKYGGQ